MFEQHKKIYPVKHFRDFLEAGTREDGREFTDFRPLAISVGVFGNAEGSSAVKLGNSNVVCGISAGLAKPAVESPTHGYIIPKIDMSFISQTLKTKLNVNNELPDTLSCMLNNVLLDTEVVKLSDLCIVPHKLVWALTLEVICIELDGGIFDAAVFAALAALKNLKLHIVNYDLELDKVASVGKAEKKLVINAQPVVNSFVVFEGKVLTDPTNEEEFISNAVLHLSTSKENVSLVSKSGGKPITMEAIQKSLESSKTREIEILQLLDNVCTS